MVGGPSLTFDQSTKAVAFDSVEQMRAFGPARDQVSMQEDRARELARSKAG